jgi:hypothetical protein
MALEGDEIIETLVLTRTTHSLMKACTQEAQTLSCWPNELPKSATIRTGFAPCRLRDKRASSIAGTVGLASMWCFCTTTGSDVQCSGLTSQDL